MSLKTRVAVLALTTFVALPATAWGQGAGGPGCTNLPLYNRALGALQGMTSACDMSVEEACRILAEQGTNAAACQGVGPGPRAHRRRREAPDAYR